MQVQFLCECGQAIRTEQGEGPLSVQCPTCGKVLTVAGTAGPLYPAAWRAAPPPPAGISVTAMVLGICGVVPGLGVLAAPVGIVLGIIALAKKRRGRGFAIAGIAAGAGGLLTVQLLTGGYVLFIVMMLSRLGAMGTRMAVAPMTMPAPTTMPTTLPAYGGPRAVPAPPVAPPATQPAGPERE
jgi:hypothetical protein